MLSEQQEQMERKIGAQTNLDHFTQEVSNQKFEQPQKSQQLQAKEKTDDIHHVVLWTFCLFTFILCGVVTIGYLIKITFLKRVENFHSVAYHKN